MDKEKIILLRKKLISSINGTWESEPYEDKEHNELCNIIITITNSKDSLKDHFTLEAIKKFVKTGTEVLLKIQFYWMDAFLVSNYVDFKNGILINNSAENKLEFYKLVSLSQNDYSEKNLILKFNKK